MKITLEFSSVQEMKQFLEDPDAGLLGDIEPDVGNVTVIGAQPPAPAQQAAAGAPGPQRGRGRPRNPPAATAAAPAQSAAATSGAPTGLTLDQVRTALMEIRNVDGNPDRVRNLVKSVGGVEQVADIPPEKFNAILSASQEIMAKLRNGGAQAPAQQSFEI